MKQLTDSELKDFAVSLLDKQGLGQYEQFIEEHEQKMKQDCEANGFYNTPAECEDRKCAKCQYGYEYMQKIDCPYVD